MLWREMVPPLAAGPQRLAHLIAVLRSVSLDSDHRAKLGPLITAEGAIRWAVASACKAARGPLRLETCLPTLLPLLRCDWKLGLLLYCDTLTIVSPSIDVWQKRTTSVQPLLDPRQAQTRVEVLSPRRCRVTSVAAMNARVRQHAHLNPPPSLGPQRRLRRAGVSDANEKPAASTDRGGWRTWV